MPQKPEQPRKLVWLVDSLDRMSGFPPGVRKSLGFALYQAQIGRIPESGKILRGFSESVWQVSADDRAGTYRAIYVVRFREAVYVLHAFQKKAKSGVATPQREVELIRKRLQLARRLTDQKETEGWSRRTTGRVAETYLRI